jgi:copper(I)-binding protein
MPSFIPLIRSVTAALAITALSAVASAHESKAGNIVVEHAYSLPTPPGATTGALYFRSLKNEGKEADRLVGASTPAARAVQIHHMQMDGDIMRMRAVSAIDLPPGAEVKVRHGNGGEWHLMLLDLKAPLKNGDQFPVTLRFEHAGEMKATVFVQQPREAGASDVHHP